MQVVGSAPGARLQTATATYFSNFSSLAFSKSEINTRTSRTTAVLSAAAALEELRPGHTLNLNLLTNQLSLQNLDRHILVFSKKAQPLSEKPLLNPFELVDPLFVDRAISYASGLRTPLFNPTHFQLGRVFEPKRFRKLKQQLSLRYASTEKYEKGINSYFRPSTGIVALCIAILENGPKCRYLLTGFNFTKRDSHVAYNLPQQKKQWFESHIRADRMVLKSAKRRFFVDISSSI